MTSANGLVPDPGPATHLTEPAPAKVNLALHVTGRRQDGYHLLDSLVSFAGVGDVVAVEPGTGPALRVDGPFARGLDTGPDNLVTRAAALMGGHDARLALTKNLPVASGIGGGSADAAATLRLLSRLSGAPQPSAEAVLALGADVPVCLLGAPARMSGIGEEVRPLSLPPFWMVLVNPGVAVATAAVFARLECRNNPPMPDPRVLPDARALFDYLAACRNDLEAPAIAAEPRIREVLDAIGGAPDCALARMSGSGATCFGLFETEAGAARAAMEIGVTRPAWWVVATPGC